MNATPEQLEELPAYVPSPIDSCVEGAYRINVVIRLLRDHDCRIPRDESQHEGGFDLSIMQNVLEGIRNQLLASVERASADKAVR